MEEEAGDIEEQLRAMIRNLGTARPGRKKGKTPMTRYRLSKLSGVSQPQLIQFLKGDRTITLRSAARLVEALGLELRPKRKRR